MRNHNSFVRVPSLLGRGAFAAALLLAGCASAPPQEASPVATQAQPESAPITTPLPEPAAPTEPVVLREDAPLRYVVKKGDTLWDIASYYLRDAWQWPELWYVNPQVRNPHLIYPGDVLELVYIEGRPRLARAGEGPAGAVIPENIEKLQPQVREVSLEEAVPTIPIEAIREFLRGPRVVDRDELKRVPYLVAFTDDRIIAGAGSTAYAKRLGVGGENYTYNVIHLGQEYRDPDTGDLLGYEAIPVAETEVTVPGDPATVVLTRSQHAEARIGDRLLPIETQLLTAKFYPHAPAKTVRGRIISVYNGMSLIGQFQIVALNRGSIHGMEAGHVLSVMQTGRVVADPHSRKKVGLPETYAGTVMVFKTTPRLSYALVMSAVRAIHVLDRVEKPVPSAR